MDSHNNEIARRIVESATSEYEALRCKNIAYGREQAKIDRVAAKLEYLENEEIAKELIRMDDELHRLEMLRIEREALFEQVKTLGIVFGCSALLTLAFAVSLVMSAKQ